MKKLLLLITLSMFAIANSLNVGDSIPNITLSDQFEKSIAISKDTKRILVAYDKDISSVLKEFLLSKEDDFLKKEQTVYIGDIRGMPSLISKFFAIPKMKKYPFSILFLDDVNESKFTKKEDNITVYTLENEKIVSVSYVSSKEQIAKLFN